MRTMEDHAHQLAADTLTALGLPEVCAHIHPQDEMALNLRRFAELQPSQHPFEYLRSGHEAFVALNWALQGAGRHFEDLNRCLDFACGFGRVLRFLAQRVDRWRLTAADIQRPAVNHVGEQFRVHTLLSAEDPDKLCWPRRYDLIWVGSLLTHVPAAALPRWLTKLREGLTREGVLVFTTHAPEDAPEHATFENGIAFVAESESDRLSKSSYGSTWMARDTVRNQAAQCGLAGLHGWPRALWWIQDLWIASREPFHAGLSWRRPPQARGRLTHASRSADGSGTLGGWLVWPREWGDRATVRLYLNGRAATDIPVTVTEAATESMLPNACYGTFGLTGSLESQRNGPLRVLLTSSIAGKAPTALGACVL